MSRSEGYHEKWRGLCGCYPAIYSCGRHGVAPARLASERPDSVMSLSEAVSLVAVDSFEADRWPFGCAIVLLPFTPAPGNNSWRGLYRSSWLTSKTEHVVHGNSRHFGVTCCLHLYGNHLPEDTFSWSRAAPLNQNSLPVIVERERTTQGDVT